MKMRGGGLRKQSVGGWSAKKLKYVGMVNDLLCSAPTQDLKWNSPYT